MIKYKRTPAEKHLYELHLLITGLIVTLIIALYVNN